MPVTICAALLVTRAAPPAPSLVIESGDAPVNTLTVQPVSGATLTVQYGTPTTTRQVTVIQLIFRGVSVFSLEIKATALLGATLGSLSCAAACVGGCPAPTLPASGQSGTDLQFSTGKTYTFTCSAAVAGSATTTKTFSLVVEGEFPQWATQRGQQFSTAGTCSVCQGMWGAGMAA
jgi:hypothetical protein